MNLLSLRINVCYFLQGDPSTSNHGMRQRLLTLVAHLC